MGGLPPDAEELGSAFKSPAFAVEVADWLAHRATPAEAQQLSRFVQLVQQAAGQPVTAAAARRPASTLARTGTVPAVAPAANISSNWQHTRTTRAARQLSAPPRSLARSSHAESPQQQQQQQQQQHAAHGPSSAAAARSGAAAVPPPLGSRAVYVTTSQSLAELFPDLWAATVPICRPHTAPNKNFVSEWGESLRQGASEAWAPYLASTSQLAAAQAAKPADARAVCADEVMLQWAARQRQYCGELLAPAAAEAVAALLAGSAAGSAGSLTLAERTALLTVLRQLSAVVQPGRSQSASHSAHSLQHSVDLPATTALLKQHTRAMTMGTPAKPAIKGLRARSAAPALATEAPAAATQPASGGRKPGGSGSACGAVDTLRSNVPLKWAAAAVGTPCSSYVAAFGGAASMASQVERVVPPKAAVGFGHVDQHLHTSRGGAFPVHQRYLQPRILLRGGRAAAAPPQKADQRTTHRASWQARNPESVARSLRAAAEQIAASQAARHVSYIPLSKAGMQLGDSAQWCSTYDAACMGAAPA